MVDPTNVTNVVVQYTAQQISDAITEKIFFAFIKFGLAFLGGIGVAKADIKELKIVIGLISGIIAVLGAVDIFQAILIAGTQTLP